MRWNIFSKCTGWVCLITILSLFLAAMIVSQGCGDDTDTTAGATTTATSNKDSIATTADTTGQVATTVITQPCPEASAPAAGCTAVEFLSLSIDNTSVNEGDMITFTAEIRGDAKSVSVIFGASGGDVSTTHRISNMLPVSTSGDVTIWQTSALAPQGMAVPGQGNGASFYNGFAISQDNVQTMAPSQGSYTVISP